MAKKLKVNLKGLQAFRKKLDKRALYVAGDELQNVIANYIANIGYNEATAQYSRFSTIKVDIENYGNGKVSLIASDTKSKPTIAYYEYGTGYYAKGKYEGELPTMTLVFESAGKTRTTSGWEYYYPNSDTKAYVNGSYGWFYGILGHKSFSTGQAPGHQMYYTGKTMKQAVAELDLGVILNEHN